MMLDGATKDELLSFTPKLRVYALSLCSNGDRADDLVQETLMRAIAHIGSFERGSNMDAWLFTILRNVFRTEYWKRHREVEDADGKYQKALKTQPAQLTHLEFGEFCKAFEKLPRIQREALVLVAVSGYSCEDAAMICSCAVGTIKSRINRARERLMAVLSIDGIDDIGPDNHVRSVLNAV